MSPAMRGSSIPGLRQSTGLVFFAFNVFFMGVVKRRCIHVLYRAVEQSGFPTYLPTYLHTYLHPPTYTYLPTYLPLLFHGGHFLYFTP